VSELPGTQSVPRLLLDLLY